MPDTAKFILERLHEWCVERIYGYPGDGINGLLGAFDEPGDKIEQAGTGRAALHVAQVIKMAREHGPDGYRDGPPEAPYNGAGPAAPRAVRARRLAVAAAGGLGGAAVAVAARRR